MKLPALKFLLKNIHAQRRLALAQLSHQKVRLAVAMGGIAFANVLIFMQLGFRSLFTEGGTLLPNSLTGDLFLLNPSTDYLGSRSFDRIRFYQATGIKGVATGTPIYINNGVWAYSKENTCFPVRIFAFNPNRSVFKISELNQQLAKLNLPNSVLFDRLARSNCGPITRLFKEKGQLKAILNNHRFSVIGFFTLGSSFFLGEGNLIMNELNYVNLFGEKALNQVSVGVLTLEPGANLEAVRAGITANVPGIEVLTKKELIAKELAYQDTNPTGPIFNFGAVMGFLVGVVIVYQVLYADVSDHLAEYATLKAIGYSDITLLGVIFQEAIILGVLGFIPGFAISFGMYNVLAAITHLELAMHPDVAITVLILTLIMCITSAAIASGKLRSADPADIF